MDLRFSGRPRRGFTLIELMISVAIVAVLASVAFPLYTKSISKSRRADAKSALLDMAQREERYMSTANTYTTDPTQMGFPSGTTFPISVMSGSKAYYTLTVTAATTSGSTIANSFVATATPISTQTTDACGTYSLASTGVQGATGGAPTAADCW